MKTALSQPDQSAKAQRLHDLHYTGNVLVLPNIWDPLGAALLESLGYPAIATASASVAYAHGYDDGENIPFDQLLATLAKLVSFVRVPVTADIESGYSLEEVVLQSNIRRLILTGIAGINIEDSDPHTKKLLSIDDQSQRLRLIRQTASAMGIPLFINARTDVYMLNKAATEEEKLAQAILRSKAYLAAGANGIYPILVQDEKAIQKLVDELQAPVNILMVPGIPDLKTLHKMGVARVSLGPAFQRVALQAMKEVAMQLQQGEGLDRVTSSTISLDFLKERVNAGGVHR